MSTPLPSTMHYAAAREPGPPDVLQLAETNLPMLKPGEEPYVVIGVYKLL